MNATELLALADSLERKYSGDFVCEHDAAASIRELAAIKQAAQGERGDVPKVALTAPARIYLQVSDEEHDRDEPFPKPTMDLIWCPASVLACEVKYIRADLAVSPLLAAQPANTSEIVNAATVAQPSVPVSKLRELASNWKEREKKEWPTDLAYELKSLIASAEAE